MARSSSKPATTLAERIARLNLEKEQSPSAPSSAPSGSTTTTTSNTRTTGAAGRISDKISRFQANAEDAPLVVRGSFGLGGVQPSSKPASAATKRVASLGLGRASVPLDLGGVVGGRSVSTGSRPSSIVSSNGPATPPPASPITPSVVEPVSPLSAITPSIHRSLTSDSSVSSPPTSVTGEAPSSVMVEASDTEPSSPPTRAPSPTPPTNSTASEAPSSARNSPLSSPIVEAALIEGDAPDPLHLDGPSTLARNGESDELKDPTAGLRKGPLGSLRAPSRSQSIASMSSMRVEAGSQASENGDDDLPLSQNGDAEAEKATPKLEASSLSQSIPSLSAEDLANEEGGAGEEEEARNRALKEAQDKMDRERAEQTQRALDEYEQEPTDRTKSPDVVPLVLGGSSAPPPPAPVTAPLSESVVGQSAIDEGGQEGMAEELRGISSSSPVLSTFAPLGEVPPSSTGTKATNEDILHIKVPTPSPPLAAPSSSAIFAPEEPLPDPPVSAGLPQVKCSDCGNAISLMELADHACAPSTLPPALSSAPSSPSQTSLPHSQPMVSLFSRDRPDQFASFPSSPFSASTPTSPSLHTGASGMTRSSSSSSSSKFSQKMDAFVAKTTSLVPQDVEDNEDVYRPEFLDDDDDDVDKKIGHAAVRGDSPLRQGRFGHSPTTSLGGRGEGDIPQDVDDHSSYDELEELASAPKGEKTHVRGGSGTSQARKSSSLPRGFDDSDSEGYEGGSVTIVRTSHRG